MGSATPLSWNCWISYVKALCIAVGIWPWLPLYSYCLVLTALRRTISFVL